MSEPFVIEQKQADSSYKQLIPLGYINHNKLKNSNFGNPVNQRGATSYSFDEGYTIDMWKLKFSGDGTVSVQDGYISLFRTNFQTYLHQVLESPATYSNGTHTLSALVKGNGGIAFFLNGNRIGQQSFNTNSWIVVSTTYTFGTVSSGDSLSVELSSNSNAEASFKWAKLEIGETNTPFVPKDYGTELTKCLRYFRVLFIPNKDYAVPCTFSSTVAEIDCPMVIPMRIAPSLVFLNGTEFGRIVGISSSGAVSVVNVSSITLGSTDQYRATLLANYSTTSVNTWVQATYDTAVSAGKLIALSAELP